LFHLESIVVIRPGGEAPGVFELMLETGGLAAFRICVKVHECSQDSPRHFGDAFFLGGWFRLRHADRIADRVAELKEIAGKSTL
jgi:hypothetical protein